MTEHVHEWRVTPSGRCQIICAPPLSNEIHTMGWDEVSRRLNATERLSAKRARNAGVWIHIAFDDERDNLKAAQAYQDALLAYATALEESQ